MKKKKNSKRPAEDSSDVVFLRGNEDTSLRRVQPPQPDADEGLSPDDGREFTGCVYVFTEDDALPSSILGDVSPSK